MGARWSSTTKRVVVALFALAALYIVYRAGDIVRPFVWAGVLAYVLLPLVALLERRLSLPRTAAAAIVFLGLLAAIFGGGRVLIPLAIDQGRELQRTLPTLLANAQNTLAETADQVGLGDLDALIVNIAGIGDVSQMLARSAVPFIVGLGRFLLELLVFLIATFFLLRDAPRLLQWFRRILPASQRNELIPLFAQVNTLLGRYVRGQMFLIGVMSTVTFVGLSILQVPFALLLAVMTGVLEVIPIVGPITAGAIACLVALGHPAPWGLSQIWYVAVVAVMYTILRHSEDYFVIPLVIGRIVKLHPAVVIFSLLTGGALYGLLGVLIAVPVAATLRLVLIYVGAKLRDEDPFPQLEQELDVPHPAPPAAATRPVGRRAPS
ncbi:MAG: AI-2E family transporter [Chloroflexi bacterium]|nr:MAG: AI-2E family transporter [Chloroflexota bacterium]HKC90060.1 AI-2E family transporter [Candidatus Limnocylindria bacterium]